MPGDSSSRSPAWRKDSAKDRKRSGAEPEWRKGPAGPAVTAPTSTRRHKFALLAAGVFVTFAALIAVVLWIRPPKPACLVLIGARYDDDKLTVPPNAYGWEGLNELKRLAATGPASYFWWNAGLFQVHQQNPVELHTDTDWSKGLEQIQEGTIVLFFALHGGADGQGPYLLPQDADVRADQPANRLRLTAVLDRLQQLPPQKKILLVLDATQVPASWPLGMLRNEFAAGLHDAKIKDRIDRMSNLVVLCASDADQRSWASDEFRTTAFTHYLVKGLQGAADGNGDGRITARELYDYVRQKVEQWARGNKDDRQEPLLLPGPDRADEMIVTVVSSSPPSEPEAPKSHDDQIKVVTEAWQAKQALENEVPSPVAYAPHLWRRYLDSLLRYEQLALLGDDNAPELRKKLDQQAEEIRRARRVEDRLDSEQNALGMPAALGMTASVGAPRDLVKRMNELWRAPGGEVEKKWEEMQKAVPDGRAELALRLKLSRLILERAAAEAPGQDVKHANELLRVLNGSGNQRPAEVQFLTLLKDLDEKQPPDDGLLRRAIALRRMAEDAALAIKTEPAGGGLAAQADEHPWSEQVFPWVRQKVEKADEPRRLGHDYLFASGPQTAQARKQFDAAEGAGTEEGYLGAQQDADVVRTALHTCQQVRTLLPYYSRWLARRHTPEDDERRRVDEMIEEVDRLWPEVHYLTHLLENPQPDRIRHPGQPTADDPSPRSLEEQTKKVRAGFTKVEGYFRDECKRLAGDVRYLNSVARDLADALTVPQIDPDDRRRMLANAAQIGHELNQKTENEAAASQAEIKKEKQQKLAEQFARRQGLLALDALDPRWFEDNLFKGDENYEQVRRHLKSFSGEGENHGVPELLKAGDEIGRRWQAMPQEINTRVEQARRGKLTDAAVALARAEGLARSMDGATVHLLAAGNSNPVQESRRLRTHDLLLWQAERTLQDHYWSAKGSATDPAPYYLVTGKGYVADARRLLEGPGAEGGAPTTGDRLARVNDMDRRLQPLALTADLVAPQRRDVTRESSLALKYRFAAKEGLPRGYPVVWLQTDESLQADGSGRQLRETGTKDEIAFNVKPRDEGEPPPVPDEKPLNATLRGVFRGQPIQTDTRLTLHRWPDLIIAQEPVATRSGIAVRADPKVHDRFGLNNSAIAIVLDASGSMAPEFTGKTDAELRKFYREYGKETKCRYHEATAALRTLLSELPAGVNVSVFVFSQATLGAGRIPVSPQPACEDTITQFRDPKPWNPADLGPLMDEVELLFPFNHTPLARAMWTAKRKGFPPDFKGFKSLIVLTDGEDNRFGKDERLQRSTGAPSIAEFIAKEFGASGIMINMIGFQVEPAEEQRFKEQFEQPIKKLPLAGRFDLVTKTDKLRATLRQLMKPQLRFKLEEPGGRTVDGIPEQGWNVGRGQDAPWFPLNPGSYMIRLQTPDLPQQLVSLEKGDFLLLNVKGDGRSFERVLYGEDSPTVKSSQRKQDWLLAVHQDQQKAKPVPAVEMLATLENESDRAPAQNDYLKQLRPRPQALWFEVKPQGVEGARPSTSLRWRELPGYPGPAYGLTVTGWPTLPGGPEPARPALSVWWDADKDVPTAATVRLEDEGADVTSLVGKERQIGEDPGSKALIENLEFKDLKVETSPGSLQQVPCLVVQVSYPLGSPVWVKLPQELKVQGQEHRFYDKAGKYTGVFWPLKSDTARPYLKALHLVSVDRFKKAAASIDLKLPSAPDQDPRPPSVPELSAFK